MPARDSRQGKPERYRDAEGILRIVKDGLCHKCGACVGLCPAGCLSTDPDGYPLRTAEECLRCGVCVQACSGWQVDYDELGAAFFPGRYRFGSLMGEVQTCYVAHAADPKVRGHGASGGAVTALLGRLLRTGAVKGALVSTSADDNPALGRGIVARTPEALRPSQQSIYTACPTLAALTELRAEEGPFAVVALPCQIHALRKRQLADPALRRKIALVLGLHCTSNPPAASTRELARIVGPPGVGLKSVRYRQNNEELRQYWPNSTMEMLFEDGTRWRSPVNSTLTFKILARLQPLGRCRTCLDQTAEFADISFADPWIRDGKGGWKYREAGGATIVMARTDAGRAALEEAVEAGVIVAHTIPRWEIEAGQRIGMTDKKYCPRMRMAFRRLGGMAVPQYPMRLPLPNRRALRSEFLSRSFRLLTLWPPLRRPLVRFILSPRRLRLLRAWDRYRYSHGIKTARKSRRQAARRRHADLRARRGAQDRTDSRHSTNAVRDGR